MSIPAPCSRVVLDKLADLTEHVRMQALDFENIEGLTNDNSEAPLQDLPPFATAHFMQALALLEQAKHAFKLAAYNFSRGD